MLALALRDGAPSYVLKSAPEEDIAKSVRRVNGGGTFLGGELDGARRGVEKLLDYPA